MSLTYLRPGVYIEEVYLRQADLSAAPRRTLALEPGWYKRTRPIGTISETVTAFIGITAEAGVKATDYSSGEQVTVQTLLNKATLVSDWTQYVSIFGDFIPGAYLPDAVHGHFANGGGPCYIISLRAIREGGDFYRAAKVTVPSRRHGNSFTVQAKTPGFEGNNLSISIRSTGKDRFSLTIDSYLTTTNGQTHRNLTMNKGDHYVGDEDFDHIVITNIGKSEAIPSEGTYYLSGGGILPLEVADVIGDGAERTGLAGLDVLSDINLIVCPDAMAGYDGSQEARERIKHIQTVLFNHCERTRNAIAILDTPPGLDAQQVYEWRHYLNIDSSFAALYYPWILVEDLSESGTTTHFVPPSGHISGIYARSDAEKGIHKTPAGETMVGVIDLELALSDSEQDYLNPIGINVLRSFTGRGIRVWGARTLSSDSAWRGVRVRRFMSWIETCIERGLQWAVTETIEPRLYARVERQIIEFLTLVWRSGALPGDSPAEAIYVRCDETNNSVEARQRGIIFADVVVTMHDSIPRSFRVVINTMM